MERDCKAILGKTLYCVKLTFGFDLTPGSSRFSNAPGPTDGNVV